MHLHDDAGVLEIIDGVFACVFGALPADFGNDIAFVFLAQERRDQGKGAADAGDFVRLEKGLAIFASSPAEIVLEVPGDAPRNLQRGIDVVGLYVIAYGLWEAADAKILPE